MTCLMVRAKRKLENGEMWFSCKSRPQRCIFQHKDVFPDRRDVFSNSAHCHFPHQAGARSLLQTGLLPGKQEKGGKNEGVRIIKKRGRFPLNQLVSIKQHNSASRRKTTYRGFKFAMGA